MDEDPTELPSEEIPGISEFLSSVKAMAADRKALSVEREALTHSLNSLTEQVSKYRDEAHSQREKIGEYESFLKELTVANQALLTQLQRYEEELLQTNQKLMRQLESNRNYRSYLSVVSMLERATEQTSRAQSVNQTILFRAAFLISAVCAPAMLLIQDQLINSIQRNSLAVLWILTLTAVYSARLLLMNRRVSKEAQKHRDSLQSRVMELHDLLSSNFDAFEKNVEDLRLESILGTKANQHFGDL